MTNLTYFLVPMVICVLMVWPVKWVAIKFGIYAKVNERTVHHGKIPRIGGVAIYVAIVAGILLYSNKTDFIWGLLLGATIVFVEGLIDDIVDVKPLVKIVFQLAAALSLIFVGHVELYVIHLPFDIYIHSPIIINLVVIFWVIGITNALNLIDGLDGLAAGFSTIVLMTMGALCLAIFERGIFQICIITAGAALGFLYHNFHPATIFMGDCGSQLLGFVIAALTLVSFKSATFITFLIPIILLFIPIMDTFSAIIRRKLKGESFATADKSHFHHQLMNNLGLGHTGAVLVIYIVTVLFGFTAYMYVTNRDVGLVMLLFMVMIFELFIEYTGMISPKYRPILNLLDKLLKRNN